MEQTYRSVFASLVGTIRAAGGVSAQDIPFYRKLDKNLDKTASKNSAELLALASDIMQVVVPGEVDELEGGDISVLDEHWSDVSHVLDTLAERIDASLDQHRKQITNRGKEDEPVDPNGSKPMKLSDGTNTEKSVGNSERVIKHQHNLEKPQESFAQPVDNSPNKPFKPLITTKPHSIQSFDDSMELVSPSEEDSLTLPHYLQPYEREISEQQYPKSVWKTVEPTPSQPWASTKVIYVDNQEKLDSMIEKLSKAKEIAVDLEHHDYRSFYGFVCLMQISDRDNDYIVDTLVLRNELQVLNTIFTDPQIIKVFHGASMDIIWLQRDFGLYVVSLFDTYHAARSLGLKRHGLAYLLEMYANFQTSKKYQLADWRMRPIPSEMMSYAQSDTHFLLNIYDQLKNELITRGEIKNTDKLEDVLKESRLTASQRYEIPGYDSIAKQQQNPFTSSWRSIANKYNLNPSQQIVLHALYDWRDEVARKEDESPRYIMPNHLMVALSSAMPTDPQGILGLSSSSGPRIRIHVKGILQVIKAAKKKVDALEASATGGEEDSYQENGAQSNSTGGFHDVASVDMDELENNYEKYQAEFLKARVKQSELFSQKGSESLQKSASTFWGPEFSAVTDNQGVFTIEHLDGLLLLDEKADKFTGSPASEVEKIEVVESEPEVVSVSQQDDKDIVFMGQSNVTHKLPEAPDHDEDDDNDMDIREDGQVTLASFSSSQAPAVKMSKSARQRARKQKKKNNSLAAAVSSTSSVSGSKKRAHPGTLEAGEAETEESSTSGSNKKQRSLEPTTPSLPVLPVAFDYNSAPTVLNREAEELAAAKKAKNNKNKKNKKQQPQQMEGPFNPYGPTDAVNSGPKGPRKKKQTVGISSGKSVTFKVGKKK